MVVYFKKCIQITEIHREISEAKDKHLYTEKCNHQEDKIFSTKVALFTSKWIGIWHICLMWIPAPSNALF